MQSDKPGVENQENVSDAQSEETSDESDDEDDNESEPETERASESYFYGSQYSYPENEEFVQWKYVDIVSGARRSDPRCLTIEALWMQEGFRKTAQEKEERYNSQLQLAGSLGYAPAILLHRPQENSAEKEQAEIECIRMVEEDEEEDCVAAYALGLYYFHRRMLGRYRTYMRRAILGGVVEAHLFGGRDFMTHPEIPEQVDPKQGINHLLIALGLGAHGAARSLGDCYRRCNMSAEAVRYYQHAAIEFRDCFAWYKLGKMHLADNKLEEAIRSFRLAHRKLTEATPLSIRNKIMFRIGWIYAGSDWSRALEYLLPVAACGYDRAHLLLGQICEQHGWLDSAMQHYNQAKKKPDSYYRKALLERHRTDSMETAGKMFMEGATQWSADCCCLMVDYAWENCHLGDQAAGICSYLARRAADQDHPLGLALFARCLYKGVGVEADQQRAVTMWEKAIAKGCAEARVFLGQILEKQGEYTIALKLYHSAATYDAFVQLHRIYLGGECGVEKNTTRAGELWGEIVRVGKRRLFEKTSLYRMAHAFSLGMEGCAKDIEYGLMFLRRASVMGSCSAVKTLASTHVALCASHPIN